jgi:phosphate transport system protein
MERHLDQQLDDLRMTYLEMAAMTQKALDRTLTAMYERDPELAEAIIEEDCRLNEMEVRVDEQTLSLLAREQPVASDLRFVVSIIHSAVNLERIGDQAVNIAERVLLFSQREALPPNPLLEELAETVRTMFNQAVEAFAKRDPELAEKVCNTDAKADALNMKILKHYIDYMIEESRSVERAVHRIIVARCLERIGDLATNLAENVIFHIQGVNVKARCHPI